MRSFFAIFVLSLFISVAAFGQNANGDTIRNKTWYRILNKTFASIATGEGEAVNLVHYASFDPVAGAFKLNVFGTIDTSKKKIAFFNLTAGGKLVSDNIDVLFNNSKFNSGMNIIGKLHFPIRREIHTKGSLIDSVQAEIKKT